MSRTVRFPPIASLTLADHLQQRRVSEHSSSSVHRLPRAVQCNSINPAGLAGAGVEAEEVEAGVEDAGADAGVVVAAVAAEAASVDAPMIARTALVRRQAKRPARSASGPLSLTVGQTSVSAGRPYHSYSPRKRRR